MSGNVCRLLGVFLVDAAQSQELAFHLRTEPGASYSRPGWREQT
jgi:hypothetical protein